MERTRRDQGSLRWTGLVPYRTVPVQVPVRTVRYVTVWYGTVPVPYGMDFTHTRCMDDRPQHFYWGISRTVCTVEYCTVDSIANAKVSILVCPMSAFEEIQALRREFLGHSQPNERFENYSGSKLLFFFFHDCDVKSCPSRNSLARIELGSLGSKTSALTIITPVAFE